MDIIRYLLWTEGTAVHAAARQVLHSVLDEQRAEELMGEPGPSQGRAEDILRILTARGVQVDEVARQRILTCADVATLDRWFDRSWNATTLSDVLDDRAQ